MIIHHAKDKEEPWELNEINLYDPYALPPADPQICRVGSILRYAYNTHLRATRYEITEMWETDLDGWHARIVWNNHSSPNPMRTIISIPGDFRIERV